MVRNLLCLCSELPPVVVFLSAVQAMAQTINPRLAAATVLVIIIYSYSTAKADIAAAILPPPPLQATILNAATLISFNGVSEGWRAEGSWNIGEKSSHKRPHLKCT